MPIATRTFRVFVSSTFEDLKEERNALQRDVFPKLAELCAKHNARFQAIDLRWGVREEASLDHRTMDICLAEIARCQKTGIKPNFIVLLGDRYGWQPAPAKIVETEFQNIRAHIPDPAVVDAWYGRVDKNAVPPEHLLKPREGIYEDWDEWTKVEQPLRETLADAAREAGLAGANLRKYEASATHQEILAGLSRPEDHKHVFAYERKSSKPQAGLSEIKALFHETVPFDGPTDLCERVTKDLTAMIEAQAKQFESKSPLQQEQQAHESFAGDRSRHFVGRKEPLDAIAGYLARDSSKPLIVYGPSGSGKSAILAKASLDHPGIRRFIGGTPSASSGLKLLQSLCEELGEFYSQTGTAPPTYNELKVMFQDRLRKATAERPLILYIDALDQLGSQDPAAAMDWLPRDLPPHCHVVLSSIDIPPALTGAETAKVSAFSEDEAETTLNLWLAEAKRQLQPRQRDKLLASFRQTSLPLYLKLAFEEARLWRSFDPLEHCILGDGLPGIVNRLFDRLREDHGRILADHALGYLAAARYGLAEDEMLAVLAANDKVWADFEAGRKHDLPDEMIGDGNKDKRKLPVVLWSRLYLDLEPYLTERSVPGGVTVSFYHRQLTERAPSGTQYPAGLAALFSKQPHWLGKQLPNQRKITELIRQQVRVEQLLDNAVAVLCDIEFISAKCAAELVFDLQDDYREAIAALPEAQEKLREEERRQVEATRWSRALVEYSHQWSELRAARPPRGLIARLLGRFPVEIGPDLPEAVKSVEPWPEQQVAAAEKGLDEGTTRLNRLQSLAGFIKQNCHALTAFGGRPGFVIQQSFNHAPNGPVHRAARASADSSMHLMLLRYWPSDAVYHSRPALLSTLIGHTSIVEDIDVTPDGTRAISASTDKTLRLWDLETGQCLRVLRGHTQRVWSVSVTPDGTRAVSAGADKTLRVWNLETGQCLCTLRRHKNLAWIEELTSAKSENPVKQLHQIERCFSWRWPLTRFGALVCSCCLFYEVFQWHGFWLLSIVVIILILISSFSVSATFVVAASALGFHYYPSYQWLPLTSFVLAVTVLFVDLMRECDWSVSVTPDGLRAVSGGHDGKLRVWDLKSNRCIATIRGHKSDVTKVSVSPDGRRAVSAGGDGTIRVWDLESRGCVHTLEEGGGPFADMSMTPKGLILASGSNRICVGHVAYFRTNTLSHDGARYVRLTPDGERAVSVGEEGSLKVWDLKSGHCLRRWEIPAPNCIALSAVGHLGVLGGLDGAVRLWDLEASHSTRNDSAINLDVYPDGKSVVSAGHGELRLWDLESGKCRKTITVLGPIWDVSVSPDGRKALLAQECARLQMVDLERGGMCDEPFEGHTARVTAVSVTNDGIWAVSVSDDRTVRLWELQTRRCLKVLEGHTDVVSSVSVTPDGKRVVSGSHDSTLRLWDLETGVCLRGFEGHGDWVSSVCVTPDGRRVVSGSYDNTLRVWDLATGQCLTRLVGHMSQVTSVTVTKDGRLAVSGSYDHTVRVWDLQTAECLALVHTSAKVAAVGVSTLANRVVAVSSGEVLFYDASRLNIVWDQSVGPVGGGIG